MEGASILELIAELAVGVLGFSGIVAALERRSGSWTPLDRRRLFSMVFLGGLVILLALLPFPLHHAGLESGAVWGWSSGIGALLILLVIVWVRRASPGADVTGMWRDREVSNLVLGFGLIATFGTPLLLGLNAAGVLLDRTFAPYLVAVLLNFGVTVLSFVRLLQSGVGAPDPSNGRT